MYENIATIKDKARDKTLNQQRRGISFAVVVLISIANRLATAIKSENSIFFI